MSRETYNEFFQDSPKPSVSSCRGIVSACSLSSRYCCTAQSCIYKTTSVCRSDSFPQVVHRYAYYRGKTCTHCMYWLVKGSRPPHHKTNFLDMNVDYVRSLSTYKSTLVSTYMYLHVILKRERGERRSSALVAGSSAPHAPFSHCTPLG